MPESKILYRQLFKSTSFFGGVQIFNILISIARSKIIALIIGPAGMGVAGLLNAAINLISGFTSLGLETSAVKFIAQKNNEQDKTSLHRIIYVLKRIVWVAGILGALIILVFAEKLSVLTFGTPLYTSAFCWLSITVLFRQISLGQLAILQGLQKLQFIAKANVWGNFSGLLLSISLYYYFGIDAIVPVIIISTLVAFFFAWYYLSRAGVLEIKVSAKEILKEGKSMVGLGLMLSLSSLIVILVTYLLQIYISKEGGLPEAGFYNAGTILLNSYVGLVFTSMGTDYFPRLSIISDDNDKVRELVNYQASLALLIITPIIIFFLSATPLIISILYSSKFSPVIPMVVFGLPGMLFRAVSWSMGYILLAKGDSRIFISTSLGFNTIFLLLSICGYTVYGIKGLGIAFTIYYFLHFLILKFLTRSQYEFYLTREFYGTFFVCIALCFLAFLFTFIENTTLQYILLATVMMLAAMFSAYHLNKKIDFMQVLARFKNKNS